METKRAKRQNNKRFGAALCIAFILLLITGEKSGATPPAPPAPPPPPPFSADIGTTGGYDNYNSANSLSTVLAGGADIWGTKDEFHFIYNEASGDFDIKANVVGIYTDNSWSKAGLMVRQDLTTTSENASVLATRGEGNGCVYQWRSKPGDETSSTYGPAPTTLPIWVRIVRIGNTYTGYNSKDGVNWNFIDQKDINMGDTIYVGLAATSHNNNSLSYNIFSGYGVQSGNVITPSFPEDSGVALIWNGIPGTDVNYLINHPSYPWNPDTIMPLNTLKTPQNQGDNYGQLVIGTFTPETSGEYNIWISSDDNSELYISQNTDILEQMAEVASVPGWTSHLEWDKYPEQKSRVFPLIAGEPYNITAVHKEGEGGDHLSVASTGPDNESQTVLPITLGNSLPPVTNIYPPPGSDITPSKDNLTVDPDTDQIFYNAIMSLNATKPFVGDVRVTSDPSAFGPSVINQDDNPPIDWQTRFPNQEFTAGHNEVEVSMEPGPQTIKIESDDGRSFQFHIDVRNEVPVVNAADIDNIQTEGGVSSPGNGLIEYNLNGETSGTATIAFPETGVLPAWARPQIEIGRNPANDGGLTAQFNGTIDVEENPGGYMFDTSNQGIGVIKELPDETKDFYITVTFDTIERGNIYSKRVLLIATQPDGQGDHFECGANNQNTFLGKRENGKTEEFIPIYDDFIGEVPVKIEFNMNIENGTYSCTVTDDEYDFVIASYSGEIPFLAGISKLFVGAFLSGDGSAARTTFSNIRITADSRDIVNGTNLDDLEPAIWGWNIPSDATLNAQNENGDIIGSIDFNTAGDNTTVTVPLAEGYSPANLDSFTLTLEKPGADTTAQGTIKFNKISLARDPQVKASQMAEPPGEDAVPGFLIHTIQAVNGAGWGFTGMKRLLKYGFVGTTARKPKDFPIPIWAQVEGTRISQSVNLSDNGALGYFSSNNGYPDETFPGVDPFESPAGDPGSGDDDDNFATEVLACIYLTDGDHIFGANSDDGTIIRVGGVKIGQTDEFKGTSNVDFTFRVNEDGWYYLWAQSLEGAGGAAFELHEVLSDGTRILLGNVDQGGSTVMVPAAWVPEEPPQPTGLIDDFEDGSLYSGSINWSTYGDESWTISSAQAQSGSNSAESGQIGNNQESILETTLDCSNGQVSFYRKVSSESDYDYLIFEIDGEEKDRWSGEEGWEKVFYPVSAGRHTFIFRYVKDSSSEGGSDKAWIDDFTVPPV